MSIVSSILRSAALPIAWCYERAVAQAQRRAERAGAARLAIPVVSVGNLSVGGTGKGPVVRWVVEELRTRGRHPVIALRGYRAGSAGSDEALEHARLLPGVPLAIGADRRARISESIGRDPAIDIAVLDDGFQHWRLARDLDLVLIDATRPGLDDAMLPAGRRREPVSALRRADAVIVTHAERVDAALAARIERIHGRTPIAWCRHAWSALEVMTSTGSSTEGNACRTETLAWLSERRVGIVAGIGHPEAFFAQAASHSREAQWIGRFADHARYDAGTLARIDRDAAKLGVDAIVTTLKDWVKIEPLCAASAPSPERIPFVVPRLSIEFISGVEALRTRLAGLRAVD